jgi:hypothetical protein
LKRPTLDINTGYLFQLYCTCTCMLYFPILQYRYLTPNLLISYFSKYCLKCKNNFLIMVVSFIGGGNRCTRRKPLTCRKYQCRIIWYIIICAICLMIQLYYYLFINILMYNDNNTVKLYWLDTWINFLLNMVTDQYTASLVPNGWFM